MSASEATTAQSSPAVATTSASDSYPVDAQGKKLKPCCACPETKQARDKCIIENGEENCRPLIDAHLDCMRKLGFKV